MVMSRLREENGFPPLWSLYRVRNAELCRYNRCYMRRMGMGILCEFVEAAIFEI